MKVAIIGAGAIGGWLAVRLALAGDEVSVLARGATLQRIRDTGIELHTAGRTERAEVRATEAAEELGPQDLVILALKAPAIPDIAPRLGSLMRNDTLVMNVGNGLPWWYFLVDRAGVLPRRLHSVDPHAATENAFSLPHVLGCTVFASCDCPEPGVVHFNSGGRILVGEPAGGISGRIQDLASHLQVSGLDVRASADIRRDIWMKLLGNACFNPVSLITGAETDDMIDDPALHRLFVRMMEETIALGLSLGLDLQVSPADRIAQARALGHIRTSMLQDLCAGRAVELDAILGSLVECASFEARVPVDTLSTILALARLRAHNAGLPGA